MASWDFDPIIYKRRKGTVDDPFCEYNDLPYLITKNKVMLQEIPSQQHRIFISGLVETLSLYPESGKFYCDYNTGYLTFNEDIDNTTVVVSFMGTGISLFPSSRVYIESENGEVTETLKQFTDNIKYMTQDQLDQLTGRVNKTGDNMTGQLNMKDTNGILFGDKFRISYNPATNTLDISYLGT